MEQFCHVLVIEDPKGRRTVSFEASTYSLGRDRSNSVVLNSRLISRHHATLFRVKNPVNGDYLYWIIDGDLQGNLSTNGLVVNGRRCFAHELKHEDTLIFGGIIKASYRIIPKLSKAELINYGKQVDFSTFPACSSTLFQPISASNLKVAKLSESALVRLASFPELLPNPIIEINLSGTITYINPAALIKFPDIQEATRQHPLIADLIAKLQKNKGKVFVRELQIGNEVFEQYVHYIAENDLIRSYVFDITERKRAEEVLKTQALVLESMAEGVNVSDENGIIFFTNPAFEAMFGYERGELIGKPVSILSAHPPEDNTQIYGDFVEQLQAQSSGVGEFFNRRKDGSLFTTYARISTLEIGDKKYWVCVQEDITERKAAEAMIQYQAFHDLLTGLPNRTLFNEKLLQALADARYRQYSLAVMFIDMDRFKTINDTLGHAVGDRLLQLFAERMANCLRDNDTVARWGGDEFTLLLPHINDPKDAAKIAQRILDALKPAFSLEGHQLHMSSSIGISLYPQDGEDPETLLRNADISLYRAKEQGRNNYRFYVPAMNSQASELLTLENRLHHALRQGEFVIYYQPQVNIKTGEIIAMEALLRWNHPTLGLVSPKKFIPLAEENGLIIPIGEWVLRTACAQNKAWQKAGFSPLRVAVNLSARQFQQPNLVAMVRQVLAETGLSPHFLELEITESTIMQNVDKGREWVRDLYAMGVHISMDDFGTGYSSLGYLKKFPFHTLKIDQSFVRDLRDQPEDTAIISAVIALGRGLNLRVVAEGVETHQQMELLQSLQCEEMQGYWFSMPLEVEDATHFLNNYRMKSKLLGHGDNKKKSENAACQYLNCCA
ncbi:EAL domain-containing protein [Cyanobacteria bacterium FACHB-472]|nr:EAL domain-containing protein [Cyanobacteria bacterium FACHB-472]